MRRKRRFRILLYNLLVAAVLLFGAEGLLAYWMNHPASCPNRLAPLLKSYYFSVDRKILQFEPEAAQYDENLFYTLRPGKFTFSNREFNTSFFVNSRGFRDDEASLEHPQIIVLGDSYAMGWGVEQEETFAQLLEKNMGLRTLNMGVSSYGTVRELSALKSVKLDSVRLLVIQYCPNDFTENEAFWSKHDSLVISAKSTYDKEQRDYLNARSYTPLKHLRFVVNSLLAEPIHLQASRAPWSEKNVITPEAAFLHVLNTLQSLPANIPIVLFSIDASAPSDDFIQNLAHAESQDPHSPANERFRLISLEGKIGRADRFVWDEHLNARGHRIIAAEIEGALKNVNQEDDLTWKEVKRWYYPNGTLGTLIEYQNGQEHGKAIYYWDNGVISREAHFYHGFPDGEEKNFNRKGILVERKFYVHGKLKAAHLHYDNPGHVSDSVFYR